MLQKWKNIILYTNCTWNYSSIGSLVYEATELKMLETFGVRYK